MNWVKTVIDRKEDYALRGSEIKRLLNTNIVAYHELASVGRLEDILDKENRCILLMESKHNSGHYTTIIYDENAATLEFFDSYGNDHDDLIEDLHYYVREGGDYFLNELFAEFQQRTKCLLIHNTHPFQKVDQPTFIDRNQSRHVARPVRRIIAHERT